MESVLRAAFVYVFVIVVFRMSGKRSITQITAADFVLLLIVAESTQQALLGDDLSVTNGVIVVTTLLVLEMGATSLKHRFTKVDLVIDGAPVVLIDDGEVLRDRMVRSRVDEDDLLTAARRDQGLAGLDEIRYAVLERDGQISIVPRRG